MLFALVFSPFVLAAGPSFPIQGWSPENFAGAKIDAVQQAAQQCGRRAIQVSAFALKSQPREVWRCTGTGADKECDYLDLGTDYLATATFRCP